MSGRCSGYKPGFEHQPAPALTTPPFEQAESRFRRSHADPLSTPVTAGKRNAERVFVMIASAKDGRDAFGGTQTVLEGTYHLYDYQSRSEARDCVRPTTKKEQLFYDQFTAFVTIGGFKRSNNAVLLNAVAVVFKCLAISSQPAASNIVLEFTGVSCPLAACPHLMRSGDLNNLEIVGANRARSKVGELPIEQSKGQIIFAQLPQYLRPWLASGENLCIQPMFEHVVYLRLFELRIVFARIGNLKEILSAHSDRIRIGVLWEECVDEFWHYRFHERTSSANHTACDHVGPVIQRPGALQNTLVFPIADPQVATYGLGHSPNGEVRRLCDVLHTYSHVFLIHRSAASRSLGPQLSAAAPLIRLVTEPFAQTQSSTVKTHFTFEEVAHETIRQPGFPHHHSGSSSHNSICAT